MHMRMHLICLLDYDEKYYISIINVKNNDCGHNADYHGIGTVGKDKGTFSPCSDGNTRVYSRLMRSTNGTYT